MKIKTASKSLFSFLFLFVVCFTSCISPKNIAITGYDYRKLTSVQVSQKIDLSHLSYTEIADGIFIARIENTSFPLIATIAKVNLKVPSLKIVATEEERFKVNKRTNSTSSSLLQNFVLPETTLSFAKRCDTNLAVNANFFTFKRSFFDKFYKPLGLFINNGKHLSPAKEYFTAMIFSKEKKPVIVRVEEDRMEDVEKLAFDGVQFGIAGYNKIIEDGRIILQGVSKRQDSRTLMGTNKAGDELFILMIDGERKALSRGLSLLDATRLFLQVGVFEGIELDGGGSSTLVAKIDGIQHQLVPASKKQCRRVAVNLGFIVE